MKRLLRTLFSVAVLGGFAAACGSATKTDAKAASPGSTAKVTIVLDWTPNTNHSGVYLAKQKGYYRNAGLDVTIIEPGDNGALSQLAAGNAQFGFSYAEQVLPARAEGVPVVSIAAVIQHNTSSLVGPADRGIKGPADLAGKTYGGFGGELETALVKALVRCDGGDPEKVKFAEVGDVDFRVGFERKDFDFVWVFDGWDVIKLRDLGGMPLTTLAFIDHTDCIPDWYTPTLVTTESFVAKDPQIVKAFLAATAQGYRLAMSDPGSAVAALTAAAPESDPALLAKSAAYLATRYAERPQLWGHQEAKVWFDFERFLRRSGLTTKDLDTTKAFTNDFLPA